MRSICAKASSVGSGLASGKHTKNYGKSSFSMGKSTISMVIFNSYVTNYQRVSGFLCFFEPHQKHDTLITW